MKRFFQLVFIVLLIGGGYVLGARFGLPEELEQQIDELAADGIAQIDALAAIRLDRLGVFADNELDRIGALTAEGLGQGGALGARLLEQARAETDILLARFEANNIYDSAPAEDAGEVADVPAIIAVPPSQTVRRPEAAATEPAAVASTPPPDTRQQPAEQPAVMRVCLTNVSNAPPRDDDLNILDFTPQVALANVAVLRAPATRSCLSSGFGPRGSNERLHRGVDYYTRTDGDVLAAAAGTVTEAGYRDDYGYMVVIDHGSGVFTRYAHLKRIEPEFEVGARVSQGDIIGPIGSSGAYTEVAHLHYEVLTGDYDTPKKSFGLQAINPYADY